jgi:hypothetical protein
MKLYLFIHGKWFEIAGTEDPEILRSEVMHALEKKITFRVEFNS